MAGMKGKTHPTVLPRPRHLWLSDVLVPTARADSRPLQKGVNQIGACSGRLRSTSRRTRVEGKNPVLLKTGVPALSSTGLVRRGGKKNRKTGQGDSLKSRQGQDKEGHTPPSGNNAQEGESRISFTRESKTIVHKRKNEPRPLEKWEDHQIREGAMKATSGSKGKIRKNQEGFDGKAPGRLFRLGATFPREGK